MEITLDALLKHKAELEKQLTELLDNANATNGAIQECQHWMDVLSQEEKAETKEDLAGG